MDELNCAPNARIDFALNAKIGGMYRWKLFIRRWWNNRIDLLHNRELRYLKQKCINDGSRRNADTNRRAD